MAVLFSPFGNDQIVDLNGNPAVNYTIETFAAGSSSQLNTYTDSTGLSANANPLTLDASGLPPLNKQFWLTAGTAYKFVVKDAGGAVFRTVDNITGVTSAASAISQFQASGVTPTYISASSFTLAGDQTTDFHAGRRLQFTVTAGTVYGTILSSVFGALTTVTMTMDAGQVLDSGLSSVNISILRNDHLAVPAYILAGSNITVSYASAVPTIALDSAAIAVTATPPVRQTVLSGPVNSSGLSAFGGATGATTVTAAGTLKATAAIGGDANYSGSIVNPSWTGLSTNGTMYLFLDITSAGVVSTGSTTLVPVYQWGGTYSTTNLQNTFNIQEMTMKVGTGAVANQVNRVFVGEVTVAGGVVTVITWYQLMGRFQSATTVGIPATATMMTSSHNLGVVPKVRRWVVVCVNAAAGYVVGEEILGVAMRDTTGESITAIPSANRLTQRLQIGSNANAVIVLDVSNSTMPVINGSVNFSYRFEAERGW